MVSVRVFLLAPLAALALAAASAGPSGARLLPDVVESARAPASIAVEEFGTTPDGQEVERYTLTNTRGTRMRVLTYGAVVQSLEVPDRGGRLDNVVLGLDSLDGYVAASDPYFGAVVGRYGNRIGDGEFKLDGVTYALSKTGAGNTLHGGRIGFSERVWQAEMLHLGRRVGLALRLVSEDGDQGFPGTLSVTVTYVLTNADTVRIRYRATTDAPTVVNLTQHTYFNLAGEGSGSVEGHRLRIPAGSITTVDSELIPDGSLTDVTGTPFDFRDQKPLGRDLREPHPQLMIGRGYDHNYVLDGRAEMHLAARVRERTTGRTLTIRTEEPGVQLYSGNGLNGSLVGFSGQTYRQGDGLALETQHFPDSPNQPTFPSTVLRPGEVYDTRTTWEFTTPN
jgi:aldose 1-epimerase